MGVCMGKKRKIQLIREENSNKGKKRACTSDFRSPFHSYKKYRKESDRSKGRLRIHLK
jgi:hypothetical protein